jgi:putative MATE family efflux protein
MNSLAREVVRLALPAFGALAAPSILLLTDAAFIGTLGTDALAGYAGGGAVFGVVVSLGYFLAFASTSVVARRFGAKQPREAVAEGINYITLGLIIGSCVGILVWTFAETFASWIGVSDAVLPHAVDWIRGAAIGAPGMMAAMAAIGLFRGLQDTKVTFFVTVFQVVINMVLCAVFIFVAHLETYGAGLAVGIAETMGFLAYFAMVIRYARSIGAPTYPTHLAGVGHAFKVGLPLLWRGFALRVVLMGTTVVAARLGDHELAAFHVSLLTWYVLSNLLDAMAIAAQAIIGRHLGASEGHLVHDIVGQLMRWSMIYGAVLGAITMLLSPFAPALFTSDVDVQNLLRLCLLMIGIHQPLAAIVFLLDGVLIGSGDTRFLAFVLTMAMCTFLPIAWAVVHFELGVVGLWCAMIAFLVTRASLMFRRSRSDAWIIEGATR